MKRSTRPVPIVFGLLCWGLLAAGAGQAYTLASLAPYHLAPGDHFSIQLAGIALAGGETVVVRFTPVGGGAFVDQTAESFGGTTVGVRVPAAAAVGQYDVQVRVNGTANTGSDGEIWVRQLPFSLIREASGNLPSQPAGNEADFKDSDLGDVDNDGFLDIIEAVSRDSSGPDNNDQLYVNQLGKSSARDCPGTSIFCNQTATQYEQAPSGISANSRTYDADLVDVDLDGDLDLVRIDRNAAATIRVLINDGGGDFDDQTLAKMPSLASFGSVVSNTAEVDVGDADGDGRPDLLLCSWSGGQNGLLINELDTSGRFELINDQPCDPNAAGAHALCKARALINRGCAFGQFDGVGGLDIILPTADNTQGDTVLLHSGQVGHTPQYTVRTDWVKSPAGGVPAGGTNGDVKVADLDGDGDDDVVVSAPQDGATARRRILWNDGGTRLVELADSRYPETGNDYDVAFADLDRDGDLDLVFGNRFSGFGPVLINKGGANGQMQFEPTGTDFWLTRSPGGVIPAGSNVDFGLSVSPGDYDLDGDIDLLTGGFSRMGLWTSDLFQKPGQARDWVFILDKTRSMVDASRDFFEPAKNVLATFSVQRRDADTVGFVTYDYTGSDTGNTNAADNANKAQRVVEVGVQGFFALANTIRATPLGTCSGFCTAIGWAIKTGNDMAADAPVPDPDLPREQILVLATDGAQNQAPHPDTIIPNLPPHVRLYTIALGSETDDRMLSALATNGGKFFFAGRSNDYASVQSALREINNDIEGDATGKQPLLPVAELRWAKSFFTVLRQSPVIQRAARRSDISIESPAGDPDGDGSERYLFLVDPADRQVRFTFSWRNPDRQVDLRVIDPRGEVVDLVSDDKVSLRRWTGALAVEVLDPLSGLWIVERRGGGNLGARKATGMASSELTVVGEAEHPRFFLGERLVVSAVLKDSGSPLAGVQGQARCLSPAKVETLANATSDSGGVLRFDCGPAAEPGSWRVEVLVFGTAARPFLRTWQEAIFVAQPTPDELDLRNAELSLDKATLTAGGGDTATATLRISRRDGSPLAGEHVTFLVRGGRVTGTATDHGDGSYSGSLVAGRHVGKGDVRARVGLEQLRNRAEFTITAGAYDPGRSSIDVLVGPLALCTNQAGTFAVQVSALDAGDNPIEGATVEITQTAGTAVRWAGPVTALGSGVYERRFHVPRQAGQRQFAATVNGTAASREPVVDVFAPTSPEGQALGCTNQPVPSEPHGCFFWFLIALAVLLLLLLIVWLVRKAGAP